MDSRLVNEKAAAYQDRTLRLTPAVFDRLGLIKKSIHLRIEEFFVSCVPFDLSLGKASLLAFLSEREVGFFSPYAAKQQKFSITWKSPYSSKPESFFLVCRIVAFRKPDPASPYCFIDIEFSTAPLAFKELLVSYFMNVDEAELFYKEAPDGDLSGEQIEKTLQCAHVSILKEGCVADRLKVVAISARSMRVFGEFEGPLPAPGDIVEFEPSEGDLSCTLKGECSEAAQSADAPGFASLSVKLEFSPAAHARMRAAVGWGKKERKA